MCQLLKFLALYHVLTKFAIYVYQNREKKQEQEQRLIQLQNKLQTRKEDAMEKKKEVFKIIFGSCYVDYIFFVWLTYFKVDSAREEQAVVEKQFTEMKSRQAEVLYKAIFLPQF